MSSSHIAYDRKSGRIVAIHHEFGDPEHARRLVERYARLGADARIKRRVKVSEGDLAVISVPSDSVAPEKQYKVDVNRKVLVEVEPGGEGVGFGVASIRRS